MSNQKLNYRKILTSERLPEEDGRYSIKHVATDPNLHSMQDYNKSPQSQIYWSRYIEYWLEPYQSREEELADLLEQALNLLDDFAYEKSLQERRANITMNAQNIIWEIKNNAPKLLDDDTDE